MALVPMVTLNCVYTIMSNLIVSTCIGAFAACNVICQCKCHSTFLLSVYEVISSFICYFLHGISIANGLHYSYTRALTKAKPSQGAIFFMVHYSYPTGKLE